MSFVKALFFTTLIVIYILFTKIISTINVSFFNGNLFLKDFFENSYYYIGLLLVINLNGGGNEIPSLFEIKTREKMGQVFCFSLILFVCVYILIPSLLNFSLFIYKDEELILQHYEASTFHLIGLLVVGPVFEELFFRQIMVQQFQMRYGDIRAVFLSSFLFSIMHFPRYGDLPMLFVFGILAAYIYLKTKNVFITIGIHSLINLYTVLHLKNPMPILRWLNHYYEIPGFWFYYTIGFLFLLCTCYYSIRFINEYHEKYISQ